MAKVKILAIDTSLSSPGAAVIEVNKGKAKLIAKGHVKTSDKDNYAIRSKHIESWFHLFIRDNIGGPKTGGFDYIVREKYSGKFGHYPIFTSWNAVDRALNDFGLEFNYDPIPQATVKKQVVGYGKASKKELDEAVRKFTGFDGEFSANDESDAVAVGLALAIKEGLIETLKD